MTAILANYATDRRHRHCLQSVYFLLLLVGCLKLLVHGRKDDTTCSVQHFCGGKIPYFDMFSTQPAQYSELHHCVSDGSAYLVSYFCAKRPQFGKGLIRTVLLGTQFSKHHSLVSLMFLAGDVEMNPGPIRRGRKPKWPCGICCYAVKDDDKALSCGRCEFWMHNDCSGVSDESYAYYQDQKQFHWKCSECEVMHFEDSFFSTDEDVNPDDPFEMLADISSSDEADDLPSRRAQTSGGKSLINKLKIAIVNFRGIRSKIPLLHSFIETEKPDVLIGTESWLNESIQTSEIFPENFCILRRDRPNKGGGGVFIAVSDSLPVTERSDFGVNMAAYGEIL